MPPPEHAHVLVSKPGSTSAIDLTVTNHQRASSKVTCIMITMGWFTESPTQNGPIIQYGTQNQD